MNKVGGEFFCYIVSPPDTLVTYFFTNPVLGIQTVARDQHTMDLEESHPLRQSKVYVYNDDVIIDSPPHT